MHTSYRLMKNGLWWTIIVVLLAVIGVLTWFLFATPAPVTAPTATSTSPTSATRTTAEPLALHDRVHVAAPLSGATVGRTLTISGEAPGSWFFEASFPIQIRDKDNNKIGQTTAQAQSDWMTTAQVLFTATITLSQQYSGPATLVLLRDNPSGLPENDDSVEIPIVIQ